MRSVATGQRMLSCATHENLLKVKLTVFVLVMLHQYIRYEHGQMVGYLPGTYL